MENGGSQYVRDGIHMKIFTKIWELDLKGKV